MPKFSLRKLVRDKIVDYQIAHGQKPTYRIVDEAERKRLLIDKLIEEAGEALAAGPERVATELADAQQALDDLAELLHVSKEAIAAAQVEREQKHGSFKRGIYIDTLELAENDPWIDYYRSDPERFPEQA